MLSLTFFWSGILTILIAVTAAMALSSATFDRWSAWIVQLLEAQHSLLRFLQQGTLPRELICERLVVHWVVERNQRSATMKRW